MDPWSECIVWATWKPFEDTQTVLISNYKSLFVSIQATTWIWIVQSGWCRMGSLQKEIQKIVQARRWKWKVNLFYSWLTCDRLVDLHWLFKGAKIGRNQLLTWISIIKMPKKASTRWALTHSVMVQDHRRVLSNKRHRYPYRSPIA